MEKEADTISTTAPVSWKDKFFKLVFGKPSVVIPQAESDELVSEENLDPIEIPAATSSGDDLDSVSDEDSDSDTDWTTGVLGEDDDLDTDEDFDLDEQLPNSEYEKFSSFDIFDELSPLYGIQGLDSLKYSHFCSMREYLYELSNKPESRTYSAEFVSHQPNIQTRLKTLVEEEEWGSLIDYLLPLSIPENSSTVDPIIDVLSQKLNDPDFSLYFESERQLALALMQRGEAQAHKVLRELLLHPKLKNQRLLSNHPLLVTLVEVLAQSEKWTTSDRSQFYYLFFKTHVKEENFAYFFSRFIGSTCAPWEDEIVEQFFRNLMTDPDISGIADPELAAFFAAEQRKDLYLTIAKFASSLYSAGIPVHITAIQRLFANHKDVPAESIESMIAAYADSTDLSLKAYQNIDFVLTYADDPEDANWNLYENYLSSYVVDRVKKYLTDQAHSKDEEVKENEVDKKDEVDEEDEDVSDLTYEFRKFAASVAELYEFSGYSKLLVKFIQACRTAETKGIAIGDSVSIVFRALLRKWNITVSDDETSGMSLDVFESFIHLTSKQEIFQPVLSFIKSRRAEKDTEKESISDSMSKILASDTLQVYSELTKDPRAPSLLSQSKLFEVAYFNWNLDDIVKVNDAFRNLIELEPDSNLNWSDFDFEHTRVDQVPAMLELSQGTLVEDYRTEICAYAKANHFSASRLIGGIRGLDGFTQLIKNKETDRIATIEDLGLVSYIEPMWLELIISAETEKLKEFNGFAEVEQSIQQLLEKYAAEGIDTERGVWRCQTTLRRDKAAVEDQMVYISIQQSDKGPMISVEFKLTSNGQKHASESVKGRMRTCGEVLKEDASNQEQLMDQLNQKLKSIATYCSQCKYFHPDNQMYAGINVPSEVIESLGFSWQIYEALCMKLDPDYKSNGPLMAFYSTPTARSRMTAVDRRFHLNAEHYMRLHPAMRAYINNAVAEEFAYHGYTKIEIDLLETSTAEEVSLKLFGLLQILDLSELLSPTDEESENQFKLNRYKWHRRIEEIRPADEQKIKKLKWEPVFGEYGTYVEPGYHKELQEAGLQYLFSKVKTVDGVAGALTTGLMSSNERRRQGVIRGGWSIARDIISGGADFAFIRAKTREVSTQSALENYCVLWDTAVLDRTDWFAYIEDLFGSTRNQYFPSRPEPLQFVKGYKNDNNEVCIKKGIDSDHLVCIVVSDWDKREALIEQLREKGILEHRGVAIEEIILVANSREEMNTEVYTTYQRLQNTAMNVPVEANNELDKKPKKKVKFKKK